MKTTEVYTIKHYLADSRRRLDRLEDFYNTLTYLEWKQRLIEELNDPQVEAWLGGWLIANIHGTGQSPLDWIEEGRLEDVHSRLLAIQYGVYL